jgi:thioesterase domain-containing protein
MPEGDTEAWVAGVFSELLGLTRVPAADQSFFELGGHSLLAIRLLSKLNEHAHEPIDLGTIFAGPTVRDIAQRLETGGRRSVPTLVPLNRVESSETPLFAICGVHLYADLARALEHERTVYGTFLPIEAEALVSGGQGRRLDVREMAAQYVALIRETRPHGPYLLGGASFGGILAYEMAQQLRAQGEEVTLLVLLDAILPRALRPPNAFGRARGHVDRLLRDPKQFVDHMRARLRKRLVRLTRGASVVKAVESGSIDAANELRDELFRRAAQTYDEQIAPYGGTVVLFRARHGLGDAGERVDPDNGWSGLIPPGSAIHVVDGTHLGLLRDPGVSQIACALHEHLRELSSSRDTERSSNARTPTTIADSDL